MTSEPGAPRHKGYVHGTSRGGRRIPRPLVAREDDQRRVVEAELLELGEEGTDQGFVRVADLAVIESDNLLALVLGEFPESFRRSLPGNPSN